MTKKEEPKERWWVDEKPTRGRPKKEDSEKKNVIIPIRVTEEERDRLMGECEKAGKKTLSEYVREKLLG